MEIFELSISHHPSESYSRQLDQRIHAEEMPYGYEMSPPPADTGDFNQRKLESDKQYPRHHGRAV